MASRSEPYPRLSAARRKLGTALTPPSRLDPLIPARRAEALTGDRPEGWRVLSPLEPGGSARGATQISGGC